MSVNHVEDYMIHTFALPFGFSTTLTLSLFFTCFGVLARNTSIEFILLYATVCYITFFLFGMAFCGLLKVVSRGRQQFHLSTAIALVVISAEVLYGITLEEFDPKLHLTLGGMPFQWVRRFSGGCAFGGYDFWLLYADYCVMAAILNATGLILEGIVNYRQRRVLNLRPTKKEIG